MTACKFICDQAPIQNNSNICHALLLELIRIQNILLMRADPPVDGARRITMLILAHPKELCAGATCARRDRPGIDARPPGADRNMAQTRHGRENEQLSLRLDLELTAGGSQMIIDLRPNEFEAISAAWA